MAMSICVKTAIVAAEADPADAEHLLRCLTQLGAWAKLATSAEQVLNLFRKQVFEAAVVGVELALDGEPLLGRLSRLPALECLVATGPTGDLQAERLARSLGAEAYLPRPVSPEALAGVLRMRLPDCVRPRPP